MKNDNRKSSIKLLIIPTTKYNDTILDIIKKISNEGVCYVALNKTYQSLKNFFEENGIDTKNIFFIDGITNVVIEGSQDTPQCIFLGAPNKLNELNISISKILEERKVKYLFFDSLSTLLIYENLTTVEKFFHTLSSKLKSQNISSIFSILKKDSTPKLNMLADEIINVKETKR